MQKCQKLTDTIHFGREIQNSEFRSFRSAWLSVSARRNKKKDEETCVNESSENPGLLTLCHDNHANGTVDVVST